MLILALTCTCAILMSACQCEANSNYLIDILQEYKSSIDSLANKYGEMNNCSTCKASAVSFSNSQNHQYQQSCFQQQPGCALPVHVTSAVVQGRVQVRVYSVVIQVGFGDLRPLGQAQGVAAATVDGVPVGWTSCPLDHTVAAYLGLDHSAKNYFSLRHINTLLKLLSVFKHV